MHLWSSEQTLYLHLLPELVETIGNLARFWIFWRYEAPLTYSFKLKEPSHSVWVIRVGLASRFRWLTPGLAPQMKRDQPWAGPSDAYHGYTYSSSPDSARCRSMASLIS